MKFVVGRLAGMEKKKEMAAKVAFMLADYFFILTGNINQNPAQESILNTLGSLRSLCYSGFITEDSHCLALDVTHEDEVKVICSVMNQFKMEDK